MGLKLSSSLTATSNNHFFNCAVRWVAWLLPCFLLISRSTADLSLIIVDLLFLTKSYLHKDWSWYSQPWFKLSLLFWAYLLLVNTPLSIDVVDSLRYALFFIRWPLFAAALAYWLLDSPECKRYMLLSITIITCFIAFDTWIQYFFNQDLLGHVKSIKDRLTGPFTKPIVGIMLVRLLFLMLFISVVFNRFKSPVQHFLYSVALLTTGLITIFITGERMAFSLCLAGFAVVLIGFWLQFTKMRIYILISLVLLLSILGISVFLMPEMAERTIHSLVLKLLNFSNSDYGLVFKAAWLSWKEHFIFGSGFHTYLESCEALGALEKMGMHCSHPHNLYLHIGAETGVIGLVLFIIMVGFIYQTAIKPHFLVKNWLASARAFTILSISFWPLIGGISLLNNWVAPLVWLGVGWVIANARQSHQG